MKQTKLSSLWSWTRHHWLTLSIIAVFVCLLLFVTVAYILHWTSTGIPSKNAWDWFTLLIVPLILAVGGFLLSRATSHTEQAIVEQRYQNDQKLALDKQREDALQAYFDRMTELLLHEQLRISSVEKEVRTIARTRTMTIIRQLDTERQNHVFSFLREAKLVSPEKGESIISLCQANFSGALLTQVNLSKFDLSHADLRRANLSGANLTEAFLCGTFFYKTDLTGAHLTRADLTGAGFAESDLTGAHLSGASLTKSDFTRANLTGADLRGTYFSKADLSGACLRKADLSNADFRGAEFIESDLSSADLRGADLSGADLSYANLSGVDLRDTNLSGADFSGADLSGARLSQNDVSTLSLTEEQKKHLELV